MNWSNDAWRDYYDGWKTRSPDDESHYECPHESFDLDRKGNAVCDECGYVWRPSAEELKEWRFWHFAECDENEVGE